MTEQPLALSILYADICDSVRLYERVGDAEAHLLAEKCMQKLAEITRRHGGSVIRTQGDGIMSTFPTASSAYLAARAMVDAHAVGPVSIRVGFNHGLVIASGGDVYGDAVNLAARVAALARSGEILTTEETVQQLRPEQRPDARLLDRTTVKGKMEPVNIYSLVSEADAQGTVIFSSRAAGLQGTAHTRLVLEYRGTQTEVEAGGFPLFLGRAPQCTLVVESELASRLHAFIESKRDHFVLTDRSTNGTYIVTDGGERVFLKRESVRLLGSGVISLGIRPEEGERDLIRYCHRGA